MIAKFWNYYDICGSLQDTAREAEAAVPSQRRPWCHILTSAILKVPEPQGMLIYHIRLCCSHRILYILI
jgi:hypothetical protein